MAKVRFLDALDETLRLDDDLFLDEAKDEEEESEEETDVEDDDSDDDDDDDDDSEDDGLHQGEGDYSPDDFREIVDYVKDLIDMEDDDEINGSVDEIGLALLYDYADTLPQTVINQIVEDLKEMFEIEDTMLESLVVEGFVKKKKGVIAKKLAKKAHKAYKANKATIKLRSKKWRKSARGKKVITMHKKLQSKLGARKGMRLVNPNVPKN